MNNIFKPRLFFWQFNQVRRINLLVTLIASAYVLIRVVPFYKPELLLFTAVIIHSVLVVRKLGSASVNRSAFLYSMGFTRDQIWWQTLFASLASGALVCGVAMLLILLGVRSAVQQHVVGNAYFPVSATKEFWMPALLMTSYLFTIPLFHYAFIRRRQTFRDLNSGWATVIVGLGLFGWYTVKMSLAICSAGELWLFAACHVPAVITLIFASRKMHQTMELSL